MPVVGAELVCDRNIVSAFGYFATIRFTSKHFKEIVEKLAYLTGFRCFNAKNTTGANNSNGFDTLSNSYNFTKDAIKTAYSGMKSGKKMRRNCLLI